MPAAVRFLARGVRCRFLVHRTAARGGAVLRSLRQRFSLSRPLAGEPEGRLRAAFTARAGDQAERAAFEGPGRAAASTCLASHRTAAEADLGGGEPTVGGLDQACAVHVVL